MAGTLYLGRNKVCPAILVGETSNFIKLFVVEDGKSVYPSYEFTGHEFDGITVLDNGIIRNWMIGNENISGEVVFKDLERLVYYSENSTVTGSLENAFKDKTGITGISFPKLNNVNNFCLSYAFSGTSIQSASFPELENAGRFSFNNSFLNCEYLTTVSFPKLKNAAQNAFVHTFQNTKITEVSFPELKTIDIMCFQDSFTGSTISSLHIGNTTSIGTRAFQRAFQECNNISDVYFDSLKSSAVSYYSLDSMFTYCDPTNVEATTVHFPSNLESAISNCGGYPLFGGISGKVVLAFDLPATS